MVSSEHFAIAAESVFKIVINKMKRNDLSRWAMRSKVLNNEALRHKQKYYFRFIATINFGNLDCIKNEPTPLYQSVQILSHHFGSLISLLSAICSR